MDGKPRWRERLRAGLEDYFSQRSFPRFILGSILILTGLTGFGISFGLLRAGMESMAFRYPLAVVGAYAVFLMLVRLWAEWERAQFDADKVVVPGNEKKTVPVFREEGRWWDALDPTSAIDVGDGCLPALVAVLVVTAIVALVAAVVTAISAAPILIAEVFIDAVLAGALYRRLKIASQEHWLGTAVRRTWLYALGTAIILGAAGVVLDLYAPGSDSIGDAVREFLPEAFESGF